MLSRERRHLQQSWLTLEPGEAKSKEPRTFPVDSIPRLRDAVAEQLERVAAMERWSGRWAESSPAFLARLAGVSRIFAVRGEARAQGSIPDKIPHDFRRSAVNSLNNAGVSIKTAMGLVGHKTMSVYNRYGIHDKKNLLAGAEKLADYFDKTEPAQQKLVQLKTGAQ